ncbi:MAG TPA: DNA-protecting protein DprA [bacterium]|nr:DNA-protecting protein DprA [bacterium]HEX68058.1 DNA-protecting protein DprA [bacterium]
MDAFTGALILNYFLSSAFHLFKKIGRFFHIPQEFLNLPLKDMEKIAGKEMALKLKNWEKYFNVEEEKKIMEKEGIKGIPYFSPYYPQILKEIPDPPLFLYVKGELESNSWRQCAIVGTRTPTPYGKLVAHRLSSQLASRGITIVSGLARGIDTEAHKGALECGKTIAVLGSGLMRPYPCENKNLVEQISRKGAVVSEFPLYTPPYRYNFPRRNRIISGLSAGVVVVEARKRSGALITAHFAIEQGREVFAVPGKVDSPVSEGTLALIQEGAKLVKDWKDIWDELVNLWGKPEENIRGDNFSLSLTPEQEKILSLLTSHPQHFDVLVRKTNLSPQEFYFHLFQLILSGKVKELPGKFYIKVE